MCYCLAAGSGSWNQTCRRDNGADSPGEQRGLAGLFIWSCLKGQFRRHVFWSNLYIRKEWNLVRGELIQVIKYLFFSKKSILVKYLLQFEITSLFFITQSYHVQIYNIIGKFFTLELLPSTLQLLY